MGLRVSSAEGAPRLHRLTETTVGIHNVKLWKRLYVLDHWLCRRLSELSFGTPALLSAPFSSGVGARDWRLAPLSSQGRPIAFPGSVCRVVLGSLVRGVIRNASWCGYKCTTSGILAASSRTAASAESGNCNKAHPGPSARMCTGLPAGYLSSSPKSPCLRYLLAPVGYTRYPYEGCIVSHAARTSARQTHDRRASPRGRTHCSSTYRTGQRLTARRSGFLCAAACAPCDMVSQEPRCPSTRKHSRAKGQA
jgi:hypothetical protein